MDKEQTERKEFLQQQLEWTKEQIYLLDQIDVKLHEMKKIAECAAKNDLTTSESEKLNSKLKGLQTEYSILEAQRKTVFH